MLNFRETLRVGLETLAGRTLETPVVDLKKLSF